MRKRLEVTKEYRERERYEESELYEKYKEEESPEPSPARLPNPEKYAAPRVVVKPVEVSRRSLQKVALEEEIQPIKATVPKVIGSLMDRVRFLEERIKMVKSQIELRKKLHEDIIREIEQDIADKRSILRSLTDVDDIRDFKLDISMLMMEKRKENVRFWKDMVELHRELTQLIEEYETERKVASLFRDLKGG